MMDDPIEMTHHGTPLEAAKDDKLQGDQQEPAKDPLAEAQPRSRIRIAAILLALSVRGLIDL